MGSYKTMPHQVVWVTGLRTMVALKDIIKNAVLGTN